MFNLSCIPGINFIRLVFNSLYVARFDLLHFVEICVYVCVCIYIHKRYRSVVFLSYDIFVWFWYLNNPSLVE